MSKIFNILYKLVFALFIVALICLGIELCILNLLPNKYLFIILGIILIIIVIFTLMFKKIKKLPLKIVLTLIEIIITLGSIFGIAYLNDTNNFFNNIKTVKTETDIYYVIVKKDSSYNNIKQLENKTIGIYMGNTEATNKLEEKIEFKKETLITTNEVIEGINKIDAIYLNSAYYDLICEENENFSKNVRIIDKINITTNTKIEEDELDITKEPFNILISGIDTDGSITKTSRSDVNIIMTVNPKTHEILLTHIPRDYYVKLHGIDGGEDKLTHSGIYGINMTLTTIEDLLDIDINYYVRVNFTTLIKLVDTIGGIDVVSDQAFSEYGYSYKKGINHLDGMNALMYSRIRHVLEGGDRARGKHQEQVITAIFQKVTSSEVLLKDYNKILETLNDSLQTNITSNQMKSFIKNQLNGVPNWNINSISVDGTSSRGNCYSMPGSNLYIMIPDQNTVDNAHKYITEIEEGKIFKEIK